MNVEQLFVKMIDYYSGDPHQIQHFLKVHSFAMRIGRQEQLDEETLMILETAAIVHDIGIKIALEKYGSSSGSHQEVEGPPVAKKMLEDLEYPREIIDRVCYLVGHHHTYNDINGLDYRILIEADFLVNIFEGGMSKDSISSVLERIFRTKTGRWLCETMYC